MVVLKDNMFSEAVGAHTWIDNAPVTVLTTVHELGSEAMKRKERRAREAFGDAGNNWPS